MKRLNYRPDHCLITTRSPKDETEHRGQAYREVLEELRANDFTCVPEEDSDKVVDFARLPHDAVLKLT